MSSAATGQKNTSRRNPTRSQIGQVQDLEGVVLKKRTREELDFINRNGGIYQDFCRFMLAAFLQLQHRSSEELGLIIANGGIYQDFCRFNMRKFLQYLKANAAFVRVRVNRSLPPLEMLAAAGWKIYEHSDPISIASIPGHKPGTEEKEIDVLVWKFPHLPVSYIHNSQMDEEFEQRGVTTADPYIQVALHQQVLTSTADKTVSRWKDAQGVARHCILVHSADHGPIAQVDYEFDDMRSTMWQVGVPKSKD